MKRIDDRKNLKNYLWLLYGCEARTWERERGLEPHICQDGPTLHEFLYPKNHVPIAKQGYLDDEINCTPLCQAAHMRLQSSKKFKSWLLKRRIDKFGELAVKVYLAAAPLRIKTTIEQILIEED